MIYLKNPLHPYTKFLIASLPKKWETNSISLVSGVPLSPSNFEQLQILSILDALMSWISAKEITAGWS